LERWASTVEEGASVGLTLSESQAAFVKAMHIRGAEVRLETWRSHVPVAPYDRIVSIGALEHFVRPEMSRGQRVRVYQEFFDSCRSWMSIKGVMSLQTIAYARGSFTHGAIADIFPESDLPRLSELVEACEGTMEILALRSDGGDYARTCNEWHERLSSNFDKAVAIVGANTARHYQKFLAASRLGFEARVFTLLRMTLRPY
jgi:cyclopropane-fatty-acyl-phospholipid synthase